MRCTIGARALAVSFVLAAGTLAGAEEGPPDSPRAKEVRALVERAADLVNRKGAATFAEFRTPDSEWFHGEIYLFSYDMDGKVLLNPAVPAREGTNPAARHEKDKTGKPFHDAILQVAREKGAGWVDYWLPRPGRTEPSHKWTYVMRVTIDGATGLVGAGFYE
jgi:signal transduction histidine kinase